jgi:hypothetical protein
MTSAPVRALLADHHRSPEDRPKIAARMRRIHTNTATPSSFTRARQACRVPSGWTPSSRRQASARPVNLANHQDPATTLTRPPGLHAAWVSEVLLVTRWPPEAGPGGGGSQHLAGWAGAEEGMDLLQRVTRRTCG